MVKEPSLKSFKEADDTALKEVYVSYRASFINFARKYELGEDEILDIYQDAIIALRENFVSGKIEELNSSIKTYLFSIGKYKIYAHLRENKKMRVLEDYNTPEAEVEDLDFSSGEESLSEQQVMLKAGLEKMGKSCRLILELFYYRGMTIDEIRVSQNYENNNTVKSQKSRCLKTLKNMILNVEK